MSKIPAAELQRRYGPARSKLDQMLEGATLVDIRDIGKDHKAPAKS